MLCKMKKELELYLHIPFCVQKCAYCDFLSAPADADARQEYVHTLIREIKGCRENFRDYEVRTVFLGGGTPSVLTGKQILEIFQALRESFQLKAQAEITIEANPGTVDVQKLKAWKQAGINRISIGLQSVNDEELKLLGRIHDYQQFLDTYKLVRKEGFQNVNIDLISAIPGQTLESWRKTLRTAAELNPEHMSVYSLMIEEGTPFYRWYGEPDSVIDNAEEHPALPDEETDRAIYEETEIVLREYGYHRYEISNYAKTDCECRHNIGYWKRTEYLGIGLGASSLIGKARLRNPSDLKEYQRRVNTEQPIPEETESLSVKDEMEEFMFLGLRMMCGVRKSEFFRLFGKEIDAVYGSVLEQLKENGLLDIEADLIRLTKRGIDVSNYVFEQFLF